MAQCRTCHYWNGPITEHIDHSHCLHPMENYSTLRKSGTNRSCAHYEKKYYYKVVTGDGHSCSTKNMEDHIVYQDGQTYIAKKGTPGIMFFKSIYRSLIEQVTIILAPYFRSIPAASIQTNNIWTLRILSKWKH